MKITTTDDRLTIGKDGYVVGIRCGRNHSGNDRITRATGQFFECAGCDSHYTRKQIAEAHGKPGRKGSDQLYDDRAN
jgi:hypothetical protein